jgi:predicted RecA/RadA family phage recombinase
MSTKEVQPGKFMEYANAGSAISSGSVVVLDGRIGVAVTDIAASTGAGTISVEGVYTLPKINSIAFTQGMRLFWDASPGELTNVGTGNTPAGYAFEAAAETATSCNIKLDPMFKPSTVITALAQNTSGTYVEAEVQAIADKVDALIAALKVAGLMSNS